MKNKDQKKERREISPARFKKIIKSASKSAINESLALDLSVLVARDGDLIRIHPNGNEEIVEKNKYKDIKVSQSKFRLK